MRWINRVHHAHRDVFQYDSPPSLAVCTPHVSRLDRNPTVLCVLITLLSPLTSRAHATPGTDSVLSFSSKEGLAVGIVDRFAIHHGHGSLDPCRGSTTAQNRRPWTKWSTFTHGSLQATLGSLLILGTPSSPFNLVQSSVSPYQR